VKWRLSGIFRPGYVAGPDDTHDVLVYWPLRINLGGEMLATGDARAPVQYIDVRDMAEWMVRCAEAGTTGIYNTVGPHTPTDTGSIVRAAAKSAGKGANVTWVPNAWIDARPDAQLWGSLRFWENNKRALATLDNRRAMSEGLKTRSVSMTLADTLAWWKRQPTDRQTVIKAGFRRRADGSGFERVSMPWNDYLQHERTALAAWHAR
jgi:2'-hydroxyisoflavone reductase